MQNSNFDLQKQFIMRNDIKGKTFHFRANTNETTSYSVQYSECDSDLVNSWIVVLKAVKKDYPNLILN